MERSDLRHHNTDLNLNDEDMHRSCINREWRLAPADDDHQNHDHNNRQDHYDLMTDVSTNHGGSTNLNTHDQNSHTSTNREWRPVRVHDCSSDAVDSHDRHLQRHQSQSESTQTSEGNNQRSNNSQHDARTGSSDNMETNHSSELSLSVDVEIFLHSLGFIGGEETIIFDNTYRLLDEDEDEELNAESDAALINEETMFFDDIYPLVDGDEDEDDEDEDDEEEEDEDEDDDEELDDDSYVALNNEETLALVERLARVNFGLSEEVISRHLKTRTRVISSKHENLKLVDKDEECEICFVCQDEYENNEIVGTLECGHEYHADCIKKWLLERNNCPLCRRKALAVD